MGAGRSTGMGAGKGAEGLVAACKGPSTVSKMPDPDAWTSRVRARGGGRGGAENQLCRGHEVGNRATFRIGLMVRVGLCVRVRVGLRVR